MDTEQITADLNRRFAKPLPEFYKRRIIVWHDEEREFTDKIEEISLEKAKIAVLTGTNYFAVKKLLGVDDPGSNYLLYSPISYETPEDNWLLDIELYSEEFRADLISIWMNDMGLPQTPGLRSAIKPYRKFMNAKERRKKIMAQTHIPTTAAGVQLSIMAALAGIKDAKPAAVIKAVLRGGLNTADNHLWQEFVNFGVDEAFWRMVAQGTGYHEKDLEGLAVHIILTASTRTIRQELMAGLDGFISVPHQAYCYDFVSDWLYAEDSDALHEIAEFVEERASLHERFMKLTVADLVNTQIFPCVNEIILVNLMRNIEKNIIDPKDLRQTVEKRRTFAWYEDVKNFFDGLYQVANIQEFYKNHSSGFHTIEPKKIWEEYISDYYKMDTYYRLFYQSYEASLKAYHADLSDMFSDVKNIVERIYVNWFLEEISANWTDAIAENLREHGRILDLPLQTDFYRYKVATSDARVYVIISDAMRYEVAAELAEVLRRETQSKVELSAMQGIFPTITKFGMAALLPHKKLSVELTGKADKLSVLADGRSTEAGSRD
ncbi:MAG: BREX-1 system phosphatase PglZ type A, partial [Selenomonadaceae bacterium]|nr:BREX-1 system phosphatase PglZ type A [Selenomonadaceae bacterium]